MTYGVPTTTVNKPVSHSDKAIMLLEWLIAH